MDLWAVRAGGGTILDPAEKGLGLPPEALALSCEELARFGKMSSASEMFVLEKVVRLPTPGWPGCAMSFGPRATAEATTFHAA